MSEPKERGHPVPGGLHGRWSPEGRASRYLARSLETERAVCKYCCQVATHFGHQEGLPMQKEKPHYSTYYTDELVEIVRQRSQADIEAFGYEFEWK